MSDKLSSNGQFELDLKVVTATEVDGIEMGVLDDGTPFLTGRGLAKVCGVTPSTIFEWGKDTPNEGEQLRAGKLAKILVQQGYTYESLYIQVPFEKQPKVNAYPEPVCMALLEYYAFEAGINCSETAKNNYRILARQSLRKFVYEATGYDPLKSKLESWRHFHDRLQLNRMPVGYFSVFHETADIVLASIRSGLIVDHHTVPDISIGQAWSQYWVKESLSNEFGERIKFPHVYPEDFPQAKANGDIRAFIYPIESLGRFRNWLQSEYISHKIEPYLKRKVKQGSLPSSRVEQVLESLKPIELPSPQ